MQAIQENKKSWLDKTFKLSENNTSVKTEVIAGITTFMTMAYILTYFQKQVWIRVRYLLQQQ